MANRHRHTLVTDVTGVEQCLAWVHILVGAVPLLQDVKPRTAFVRAVAQLVYHPEGELKLQLVCEPTARLLRSHRIAVLNNMDPNSFVDVSRLFQFLDIREDQRNRAEKILRIRMQDILVCLPRALNGWTEAELVIPAQSDIDPPTYKSISELSPDRRLFYLSDKKRKERVVFQLPQNIVAAITTDARFPLDLCCVHLETVNTSKFMFVCYSSAMVNSAKVLDMGEEEAFIADIVYKANAEVNSRGVRPESDILSKLPRSKKVRVNPNYQWLPVGEDGRFLLGAPHYPNKGSPGDGSVSALKWCLWLNILGASAPPVKTRVARMDDVTSFSHPIKLLVYKNPFHLVVQGLTCAESATKT